MTIPVVTVLFLLVYTVQSLNAERIDMRANIIGDGFYFYLAALIGITAFLLFVQKIDHSRSLLFLGKNSIVILVLHMPILNVVRAVFHYGLGVDLSVANTLPWTILFTATTVLLTIPFIFLFNRFPWFLGKPPKQTNDAPQKAFHLQKKSRSLRVAFLLELIVNSLKTSLFNRPALLVVSHIPEHIFIPARI